MEFVVIVLLLVVAYIFIKNYEDCTSGGNNEVTIERKSPERRKTLNPETVAKYIKQHYTPCVPKEELKKTEEPWDTYSGREDSSGGRFSLEPDEDSIPQYSLSLEDSLFTSLTHVKIPFGKRLNDLLAIKRISSSDFCKYSLLSRQWLSNVVNNHVNPTKNNALAACIGLKLDLPDAIDLLNYAGYAFSDSDITDLVVRCYIKYQVYNIDDINAFLVEQGLRPLGSKA